MEPDLTCPLPGAVKSPDVRTRCSSTRSTRTSCTSCHPRSGCRSRTRSTWLLNRPRRWWRPSRTACWCPRWGTKVARRGGCTCVRWPGLSIPQSPHNPHCSAHTLWEVGQLSEQPWGEGAALSLSASWGDPGQVLGTLSLSWLPTEPETKGKLSSRGMWQPPAGGASLWEGGGQVDSPLCFPQRGRAPGGLPSSCK